ncbi:hypothetical protein [Halonotius sp. GCM10025705]|uniref:hypothetical protein n=1 Tax=Halonotius sp. GCM10025705 TaxID=3252678 RepID=UPI00360ACD61
MTTNGDSGEELSQEERNQLWRKRARSLLIGIYATDEYVEIYGLRIQYSNTDRDFVDVYSLDQDNNEKDLRYLDTVQIAQFATVGAFLAQLRSYFTDEQQIPEEPEEDEENGEGDPLVH